MYFERWLSAALMAGLLVITSVARADDDDEEEIAVKDLPAKVVAAIAAKFPGAKITEAEQETEDGKTVYEVEIEVDGDEFEVEVSAEGKILEIEEDDEDDDDDDK